MGSRASRYAPPPRRRPGAAAAITSLVVKRRVLAGAIAAVAALSATLATARPLARAGAGGSDPTAAAGGAAAAAADPHATMQASAFWTRLSPSERQIYLTGFLAGAAAEQVRARAESAGRGRDSTAVSSGAVEALRRDRALHFPFAPSLYSAQVDDFYWNNYHAGTPIVDALIASNRELLKRQGTARTK